MSMVAEDDLLTEEITKLKRFLRAHTSRFVLAIVQSPSGRIREKVVRAVRNIALNHNRSFLHYELAKLTDEQVWRRFQEPHTNGTVFLLTGLYSGQSDSVERVVSMLNRQREQISEFLRGPTLLVVTEDELRRFFVDAPDFADWRAADFSFYPPQLFDFNGYREFLRSKCSTLQLSAISTGSYNGSVGLWSMFVPQLARKSLPMPDFSTERLRNEELKQLGDRFSRCPIRPVLELIEHNRRLVILGDPGSGKTSIVKFCVMTWVNQKSDPLLTEPLPFWVDFREFGRAGQGLEEYLDSSVGEFGLRALQPSRLLDGRATVVYFDDLDEIFDTADKARTVEAIVEFATRYPAARIVVTSRIIGYDSRRFAEVGFAHATLEDFNDSQILEFLRKWHSVAEEDDRERKILHSRLESALSTSRSVRKLARNPLLLTMMALVSRNNDLPRDRVELYREASRVLLHDWDASRGLHLGGFGRQEKEALLREIAGAMQMQEDGMARNLIGREALLKLTKRFLEELGIRAIRERAQALVRQLTERNFILCYSGADSFSFVHRTFLEYYCAAWFVQRVQKSLSLEWLRDDVFESHWRDEAWHEVLRLIVGMIHPKQAEQMILVLMFQEDQHAKAANLFLAALCLGEIRNRQAVLATSTALYQTFIDRAIHYEPPYPLQTLGDIEDVSEVRRRAVAVFAEVWRVESRPWLHHAAQFDKSAAVRISALCELAHDRKDDPELQ